MVKPEIIRRKLEKIDEYVSFLEKVKGYSKEEFLNQPEIWASSERFLQLAIESINDIASRIIAEENYGPVEQYRDIPRTFFDEGFIEDDLKQKWMRIIGCRNLLAHGYAHVYHAEVYNIAQHHLNDLTELRKALARFL